MFVLFNDKFLAADLGCNEKLCTFAGTNLYKSNDQKKTYG